MIKIFGKIRYHWQPELSWLIIYWSIAIAPIFIGLSLLFERTRIPSYIFILFALFIVLVNIGFYRYFIIEENGILRIVSLNPRIPKKIAIASIDKIEVTYSTLSLHLADGKSYMFYMRKWPKKYFLDALAVDPDFRGEVELLDNFTKMDYFEVYKKDKKTPTKL
ncbi:EbsA family protein [Streptococcus sp. H49]|uniref:EbsA family protein n=1 Tax=Streptococcus huangxiaojuni TaxID=3237239 RepID=UPI0034A2954D